MSGKLFAFQVSEPIESPDQGMASVEYDPHAQTRVWRGGTKAQAYSYCCRKWQGRYTCTDTANGFGCSARGIRVLWGFQCD